MSRIDRIRLTEIFKTLSSSSKKSSEIQRSKLDSRGPVVDGSKLAGRDYIVLKEQIKNRLKLIDKSSNDSAPTCASMSAISCCPGPM